MALAPLFKSVFVSFTYNDIVNVFFNQRKREMRESVCVCVRERENEKMRERE